jgi:hypothetical protein
MMGLRYLFEKHTKKGYDGAEALKWNLEVKPFFTLMNCSNKGRHARIGGNKRSHVALKCCWKRKMLLSICVKALRRKKCQSIVNL